MLYKDAKIDPFPCPATQQSPGMGVLLVLCVLWCVLCRLVLCCQSSWPETLPPQSFLAVPGVIQSFHGLPFGASLSTLAPRVLRRIGRGRTPTQTPGETLANFQIGLPTVPENDWPFQPLLLAISIRISSMKSCSQFRLRPKFP